MGPKKINEEELLVKIKDRINTRFCEFEISLSKDLSSMKDGIIASLIEENKQDEK